MTDGLKKLITPSGLKVGLVMTLVSLVVYSLGFQFFQLIEFKAYDINFMTRGATAASSDAVVIAAIDEKSLDDFGRWPWPRARMAELINKLGEYGAAAVAFDVIFSEADESSGVGYVKALKKRLGPDNAAVIEIERYLAARDNDAMLASAVSGNSSVVLGYFFHMSEHEVAAASIDEDAQGGYIDYSRFLSIRSIDGSNVMPHVLTAAAAEENIDLISENGSYFGYFNIVPDVDGTIRRVPLVVGYSGNLYPHLSLESVRVLKGAPPLMLNTAEYGVDSISMGDEKIYTDERGGALINFRGPQRTFKRYSFSDIASGRVPVDELKGKIVLVGATATGIYDVRVTPFEAVFPGVEIHANIIDNMLSGDFINRPDWIVVFDVLAIIIIGLVLAVAMPRLKPLYSGFFTMLLVAAYSYFNYMAFAHLNLWLTYVYPVLTIIIVSASITIFQFMVEEKKRREIKHAFSHYVSPSLVSEILKNPGKLVLGGEEKRLTVFFSDIRGFTTLSEGMKPQELVKLINGYLTPMTDIVLASDGTVDKYMGDAIMAFWGAPIDDPNHARKACEAALKMLDELERLRPVWAEHGAPDLDIGIGLSTGKVTVGNMGSKDRFDYTVLGDTINLGSRLEGMNKQYGTRIIVAKYTYEDVKDLFLFRELDLVRVKGKEVPIKIYELLGKKDAPGQLAEVARKFEEGLSLYRAQKWDEAEETFKECILMRPDDGPSAAYLERVMSLREERLPADWDGVFVMTSK